MTPVRAARGTELRCRGWRQEGLLRMLENVLEVGEAPEDLIVYASLAKAARNWDAYHELVRALRALDDDQTLVVQSGKPIGIFASTPDAPLVVMACSNLAGRWATEQSFYEHADRGLLIWGGLTAGDWQYIGAQGVLQGVYELLGAIANEHFGGSLAGRLVVTAGLGGMGSAQPTAIRLTQATGLIAEIDPDKLRRAAERGALDEVAPDLDSALQRCRAAAADGSPLQVGLRAHAADLCEALVAREVTPAVVTDLTCAHDLRYGYVPRGLELDAWRSCASATRPRSSGGRVTPSPRRYEPCSSCAPAARSSSRTGTTCAPTPTTPGSGTPTTSTSSRCATSARCSARESARSAGWR